MALLLLAAILATLLGAPARVSAAPGVDTWAAPSPPRIDNSAPFFYDPVRKCLTLVDVGQGYWTLPDSGLRTWTRHDVPSAYVPYSGMSQAVFDPIGHRLLIVARISAPNDSCCSTEHPYQSFLDVWQLVLAEPAHFERLDVPGPRPLARAGYGVAFDPRRNRLIVEGGYEWDDSPGDNVLALDLAGVPTWSILPYPGPRRWSLQSETLVDPVSDRLICQGGEYSHRNEVWALPLAGGQPWENWSPTDTLPRLRRESWGRGTAIDPVRRKLIQFNGVDESGKPDTTGMWEFDLDTHAGWTPITVPGAPARTQRYAATDLDPATGRLFLRGGHAYDQYGRGSYRFDAYERTPNAPWTTLSLCGEPLDPGEGIAAALDVGNQKVLYMDPTGQLAWISYGLKEYQDWEPDLGYSGPFPRQFAAFAWDAPLARAFLFGGRIGTAELNDLWQVSFPNGYAKWLRVYPEGDVPGPRYGTASVYDAKRRRLVVFGGFGGHPLDETWALELSGTPRWHRLETHGSLPSARFLASAVYDSRRDGMILYGGATGIPTKPTPLKDTWFLSFSDGDAWVQVAPVGSVPLGRYEHASVYDPLRDRMLVFWGLDGTGARFECASLELSGVPTWKDYAPAGPVVPNRYGLQAFYLAAVDRAMLLGGDATNGSYESLRDWYIDFAPAADTPAPLGRPVALLGMAPNPTHAGVDLAFDLPAATPVRLRIYDARGRLVKSLAERTYAAGRHLVYWDGTGEDGYRPRPGVYFARLVLGSNEYTGKVVLLR